MFLDSHISAIIWCLSFSVRLTSLSVIISRSVHAAAKDIISFTYLSFCPKLKPCNGSSLCFGKRPSWSAPSLLSSSTCHSLGAPPPPHSSHSGHTGAPKLLPPDPRAFTYALTSALPVFSLSPLLGPTHSSELRGHFLGVSLPWAQTQSLLVLISVIAQLWSLNNDVCDYLFDACLPVALGAPWEQGGYSLVWDRVSCPFHRLGRE